MVFCASLNTQIKILIFWLKDLYIKYTINNLFFRHLKCFLKKKNVSSIFDSISTKSEISKFESQKSYEMNLKFKDELFVLLILHLKDIILLLKESTKNTPILYIKKELNDFELEKPKSLSINF